MVAANKNAGPVGVRTFQSRGRQIVKNNFTPFAAGEYDLKLECDNLSIGKAEGKGKFPYLNVRFRALGTAEKEGAKDRLLFHMFFTSLKPGEKGGVMIDRDNQLMAFARALGEELEDANIKLKQQSDENDEIQDYLDPQMVKQWLQNHDGAIVKARVKVRKDKQYGDKNEVDFFVLADDAEGGAPADPVATGEVPEEAAAEEGNAVEVAEGIFEMQDDDGNTVYVDAEGNQVEYDPAAGAEVEEAAAPPPPAKAKPVVKAAAKPAPKAAPKAAAKPVAKKLGKK
jgi:hypothetical protein